jgi:hypothetical protein
MRGKRKVKTRTLENHKGAAPKFVLAFQGCATRQIRRQRQRKNVGAPTFKVLLEGYLVANEFSNGFPDVLKRKRLVLGIRMSVFPK